MVAIRRVAVVIGIVLGQFASVPTAGAQQGWGATPWSLSTPSVTGGAINAPKVDVTANGDAVAVWNEPGATDLNGIRGSLVRAARFDAASGSWSAPEGLFDSPDSATVRDVAVDDTGHALALWTRRPRPVSGNFLSAARYDATLRQWTSIQITPSPAVAGAWLAMNADGDAVVCWTEDSGALTCRRYDSATTTWSAAEQVSSAVALADVAIDAAGDVVAVWSVGTTTVRASRFDAVAGTWSAAVDLATGLGGPLVARVATNAAGDTAAAWTHGGVVSATRMPAGGGPWTAVAELAPSVTNNELARLVVDPAGRVTVAWVSTTIVRATATRGILAARWVAGAWSQGAALPDQTGFAYGPPSLATDGAGNVHVVWSQSLASPQIRLLASRYAVSTGQWTTASNLSALNQSAYNSDVAVDAHGSAVAVWFQTASGFSTPQALRWAATPGVPVITSVTPAAGMIEVAFDLPPSSDPVLAQMGLVYSLDGGALWHAPNLAESPLRIRGLTDGVRYSLRLVLHNSAGYGTATTAVGVRSGTAATPTHFRVVARIANTLTFAWVAPAAGLEPTGYVIQGGLLGTTAVLAELPTGGPATQFTVTVPTGLFFTRVIATAGAALRSAPSNEAPVFVGYMSPPSSPAYLLASVSGSTVALSWTLQLIGPPATSSSLVIGTTSPQIYTAPVTETVTLGGVPANDYVLRVAASNGNGASALSNTVEIAVPAACTAPPLAPDAFSASTQGGMVFLDWLPPMSGGAVSSYLVRVTGAITATLPMTAHTFAVPAPSGTYHLSVASVGLCGTSAPTAVQTVVVP